MNGRFFNSQNPKDLIPLLQTAFEDGIISADSVLDTIMATLQSGARNLCSSSRIMLCTSLPQAPARSRTIVLWQSIYRKKSHIQIPCFKKIRYLIICFFCIDTFSLILTGIFADFSI